MKTDHLSEIRARLWDSLEMAHVRVQLIVLAAAYAVFMLIFWFRSVPVPEIRTVMLSIVSILFLPVLLFWLWRVWRIFRSPEEYVFCRTELGQPHHFPMLRGMFTFMGVVEADGSRFAVETHAIFADRGIVQPLMEDYIGRTVTIAWNRKTEMVVVIG